VSLTDLAILYCIAGAGCAIAVFVRSKESRRARLASSVLALAIWPIWAPLALVSDPPRRTPSRGRADKIETELDRAVAAAAGSPFEILLPKDAADRMRSEIHQACARIDELEGVLAQPGFDLKKAEERVNELTFAGSPPALRSAVVHRNNIARLRAMRDKYERALEDLAELAFALRSQLVLARYAGSSPEGVGGIVTELWARVEGLDAVADGPTFPEREEQELA
jgi:hypothetical protein